MQGKDAAINMHTAIWSGHSGPRGVAMVTRAALLGRRDVFLLETSKRGRDIIPPSPRQWQDGTLDTRDLDISFNYRTPTHYREVLNKKYLAARAWIIKHAHRLRVISGLNNETVIKILENITQSQNNISVLPQQVSASKDWSHSWIVRHLSSLYVWSLVSLSSCLACCLLFWFCFMCVNFCVCVHVCVCARVYLCRSGFNLCVHIMCMYIYYVCVYIMYEYFVSNRIVCV